MCYGGPIENWTHRPYAPEAVGPYVELKVVQEALTLKEKLRGAYKMKESLGKRKGKEPVGMGKKME